MTTWLQHHDHVIERCDASTGHSVLPIAYCRDTATARLLVDAANNYERVISENDKLREELLAAAEREAKLREVLTAQAFALSEGGAR